MVFGEDDPTALALLRKLVLIHCIWRKVIVVNMEDGTSLTERVGQMAEP